jgi:hypothetical protein
LILNFFFGHSTSGAAALKAAAASGVSVESILSAGHWSAESTFTRLYRRDARPLTRTHRWQERSFH